MVLHYWKYYVYINISYIWYIINISYIWYIINIVYLLTIWINYYYNINNLIYSNIPININKD